MNLRPATADDVAAVAELERDLFGVDAWSASSVAEELTGPDRFAVVAVAEESACEVVGYVVTRREGDVVDLQRIGVGASYRRRGLARSLLTAVREQADRTGAERMLLEVSAANEAARAFYAAEGFTEIGRRRRYYRDGSDALVLSGPVRRPDGAGRG